MFFWSTLAFLGHFLGGPFWARCVFVLVSCCCFVVVVLDVVVGRCFLLIYFVFGCLFYHVWFLIYLRALGSWSTLFSFLSSLPWLAPQDPPSRSRTTRSRSRTTRGRSRTTRGRSRATHGRSRTTRSKEKKQNKQKWKHQTHKKTSITTKNKQTTPTNNPKNNKHNNNKKQQ